LCSGSQAESGGNQDLFCPVWLRTGIFAALFWCGSDACAQQTPAPDPPARPASHTAAPQGAPAHSEAPDPGSPAAKAADLGASSISGIVQGTNGEIYSGVQVSLKQAGGDSAPALTQKTDENGQFRFTGVAPGAFKLTLSSKGFVTQTVSGVVQPGENYDAQKIVLPVADITSNVRVTASVAEIAQAQLNFEEKQRVLGVIPNFYVTYDPHAAPLDAKQKFELAWKSSIDPVTWVMTGAVAGVEQADNTFAGYGQGAKGYAKRFAAGYADSFDDTMLAGALLPALFKQDPRYFVKGTGSVSSRFWYAVANAVICKGDNGHWQANYSAILGGLAAGGISNLYYPASDREGLSLTFESAGVGMASGAVQNLFQEFVVKKLTPHLRHDAPPQP